MDSELRSYKKIGILLKERLADGIYNIGDRLPTERDLAAEFGVSRTVIREALIMLELENLVSVKKGSGVYVVNLPVEEGVEQDNHSLMSDLLNCCKQGSCWKVASPSLQPFRRTVMILLNCVKF